MSHPFEHRRPTELEDRAYAETIRHFTEPLQQFPASRDDVARLECDAAKIALTADMAVANSTANVIPAADGAPCAQGC